MQKVCKQEGYEKDDKMQTTNYSKFISNFQFSFAEDYLVEEPNGFDPNIFDPKVFRENADIAVSRLEKYLAGSYKETPAFTNPSVLLAAALNLMTKEHDFIASFDRSKFKSIIDLYINAEIQLHSTGYAGQQFAGVVPLAGIFDFVTSIVNQPSLFDESGQLPVVIEQIMANELNRFIGYDPDEFTMVTNSGGALSNLTALLAARNDKYPIIWSEGIFGLDGQFCPAIAVSAAAYESISNAAGILGIGENQIIKLPVNSANQICIEKVGPTLVEAAKRGLKIFCMVASAGTNALGAFDPIDELAAIARDQNIWFHVDAAHGGSLLVSDTLKHKLKGIEKADSITWDVHNLMFVPAPCSLLFYKSKDKCYGAFRQNTSYSFENESGNYSEFYSGARNLECTKRPMLLNLWALWALYGKALFSNKIEYLCELTEEAYCILNNELDFETIHQPESNILCFRYTPENLPDNSLTDFQVEIRNRIRQDGKFFISKVDINGSAALQVAFVNHQMDEGYFHHLLHEIRKAGQELINTKYKADKRLIC